MLCNVAYTIIPKFRAGKGLFLFLKKVYFLKKEEFEEKKQKYCEILLQFKIINFYFNAF